MRFLNSVRLMIENFKYAYKMLLYKCIIALVASAICCSFVLPELIKLWQSEQIQSLFINGKAFFRCLITLDKSGMETAKDAIVGEGGALASVWNMISDRTVELVFTALGVVLVYLAKRIADTVCHFAVGGLLNDKMSSYAETPFTTSAVSNLGKAFAYSLVYVPLIFLYDMILIVLCCLILASTPIVIGGITCVTLAVFCQSLKLTLTVYWMPAMTNGKRLRDAMKPQDNGVRSQNWKVFGLYVVSVYIVLIINVAGALFTLGSALIVTLPASYFFFICEQYVCYYTIKGKRYFLSRDKIAENPDKGDAEHFFAYVQNAEAQQLSIEETAFTNISENSQNSEKTDE